MDRKLVRALMDDELLKLECLKVALSEGLKGSEAIKRTKEIFDFLKDRNQGGQLKAGPVPQAKVVGKDGDLEGPFKDYLRDDK
jgi:hypothetical protein